MNQPIEIGDVATMPAQRKRRLPNQGRPPAWHVERFAAARAQGKSMAESALLAGYPKDKSELGARKAGERMQKHPEVQKAIQRHKRDLIKDMAKKQVADLWPADRLADGLRFSVRRIAGNPRRRRCQPPASRDPMPQSWSFPSRQKDRRRESPGRVARV